MKILFTRRVLAFFFVLAFLPMQQVFASDESDSFKENVDALNASIQEKSKRLKDLDRVIQTYKTKIVDQEQAMTTLQNQVSLLENRVREKQLATERTKQNMELVALEMQTLNKKIEEEDATLKRRVDLLGILLRRIEAAEQVSLFDVFVARSSLSEFFSHMEEVKRLERQLLEATQDVRVSKQRREAEREQLARYRASLQEQAQTLRKEQRQLEQDQAAKVSFIATTQTKEEEFQKILYELRQEQQEAAESIEHLRDSLKDRLESVDQALARGDVLLNWPVPIGKGIAAHFHDPTYPFRKLFEHPGVDISVSVGTPVHVAAGGYVAWTRTGKQYGNYIMVVHPGGIATVYAHLSKFVVKADTYVERGDMIALSGGRPGDSGAGLSTGPHLHFEVRQDGIPVNPENFLPALEE